MGQSPQGVPDDTFKGRRETFVGRGCTIDNFAVDRERGCIDIDGFNGFLGISQEHWHHYQNDNGKKSDSYFHTQI